MIMANSGKGEVWKGHLEHWWKEIDIVGGNDAETV